MNCRGCVAKMHREDYPNLIRADRSRRNAHEINYLRRLAFARDNGCNTAVITGDGEPMADINFLDQFAKLNWKLSSPFRWIEIQTSGAFLNDDNLTFLRDTVGVSTISLSVWDLFTDRVNMDIFQCPEKLQYNLSDMCGLIVSRGFNLRLSLNMTKRYKHFSFLDTLERCIEMGTSQITFRRLYDSGNDTEQDKWILQNADNDEQLVVYKKAIRMMGKQRGYLSFGAELWSVNGISIVIDDDCMSETPKHELKYVVLRPNCKLYRDWEGTLLF